MSNVLDGRKTEVAIADLALGKRSVNFTGEDIFYKLTKGEVRQTTIESAPVYFRGADGAIYDTRRYKAGLRNGQLAGIMSNKYTFVSNEKAYELIKSAGFEPTNVEFSNKGNAMFVQVFDGKSGFFDADNQGGDKVNVGVMIRNSIDGTTSFGGDIFTYRAACSNGAILGKKELGSFSVKHVGNYERLVATFRMQLGRAFELSRKVKTYYRKAQEVNVNLDIAKALVNTQLPKKFLPEFINVDKHGTVTLQDKNRTVWQGFNDVTEKAWHAEKLGITSRRQYTERANSWLLNVTEPLLVTA
jgi:hypothetical protein